MKAQFQTYYLHVSTWVYLRQIYRPIVGQQVLRVKNLSLLNYLPVLEGAVDTDTLESIMGLDLSTVVAFFNLAPFLISPNNASLPGGIDGGGLVVNFLSLMVEVEEEEVVVVVQPLLFLMFQINEEVRNSQRKKSTLNWNLVSVICFKTVFV